MSTEERLIADYAGTGLTIGKHPMAYRRVELEREKILSANELRYARWHFGEPSGGYQSC